MSANAHMLELHTAPHVRRKWGISAIMVQTALALLPLCAFSVWQYGLSALALIVISTASCLAAEALSNVLTGRKSTLMDGSAAVTGLLLALTLPPGMPLWMAALGGVIAITLGKVVFGGLGASVFNPVLVGRAFLQAAYPAALSTWSPPQVQGRFLETIPSSLAFPFCSPPSVDSWVAAHVADGFSGATPLALQRFHQVGTSAWELLIGTTAGSAGESSALLIALMGLYLVFRRVVNWRIPLAVLGSAFVMSFAFHALDGSVSPGPVFTLLSGGLMLGAFFLATDLPSSPVTPRGAWLYGAFIGAVTVLIRVKGGQPEGVMYAILLGNALTPLIERWTQPRILGQGKLHNGR